MFTLSMKNILGILISLTCIFRCNQWYCRWVPGEPNNYHGVDQSWVETYGARNLTWNDAPCTGLKKYICELVPESVMDTVVVG